MFSRVAFVFPSHHWMTDPSIPGDGWTPDSPEWTPCFALLTCGFCFTCWVKQREQAAVRGWVASWTNSTKRWRKTHLGLSHKHFPGIWEGLKPDESLKASLSPPGKHVLCCFPCKVWGTKHALSLPAGLHTTSKACQWQAGKAYLQLPASWWCLHQGEVSVEMEILWRLLTSTGLKKLEMVSLGSDSWI